MADDKKKLYVSFTNLVKRMQNEEVTPEDLEEALFYFRCAKIHLEKPIRGNREMRLYFNLRSQEEVNGEKPPNYKEDLEGAIIVYDAIKTAVSLAETEGRAVFRELEGMNTFEQLNQLLEANGIDVSTVRHLEQEADYSRKVIREHYKDLVDLMTT